MGYCANYEQGCFLNISYAGPETREMVFIYFPLNGSSHQAIVNRLWQEYLANYRDVRYGPQTTHTVDGDEFTFQEFVPPNLYSLEGYHLSNYYSAHGYVAVADGVIEITFWASSEAEFRDSYGQFIDILDSIDLKHRVAMPITSQGSANE
ncbi:MAG: hypothetical protein F9K46_19370 [Anaerolineae bacterium]|nr:MAG: hypothetical protein F9K46_19370 [Anaerolineae bacterium]